MIIINKYQNILKKKFDDLLELEKKNTQPTLNFIMETYNTVQLLSDMGDDQSLFLYNYQSSFLQNYIEKSSTILKTTDNNNFFDLFFKQTERINFIIYEVCKMYAYLDRYYTTSKLIFPINKNALEIYKKYFFIPSEDKFLNIFCNFEEGVENGSSFDNVKENIIKYINIFPAFYWKKPKLNKKDNKYFWINIENKNINIENYKLGIL